jgi:hypothetical protein
LIWLNKNNPEAQAHEGGLAIVRVPYGHVHVILLTLYTPLVHEAAMQRLVVAVAKYNYGRVVD